MVAGEHAAASRDLVNPPSPKSVDAVVLVELLASRAAISGENPPRPVLIITPGVSFVFADPRRERERSVEPSWEEKPRFS